MKLQAVYMLALMVGVIQITLGLLKMGYLVRFVPFSVMTGFLNGVAILIILGQLGDFTGYSSPYSNRVVQAFDTAVNTNKIILPILVVGLVTVILILLFNRSRKTKPYSLILAMVIASTLAALPGFDLVPTVGDVTSVPSALPHFYLPNFSLFLSLIVPAFALSIIGLVQGAGISQGYPNPDGKFPDPPAISSDRVLPIWQRAFSGECLRVALFPGLPWLSVPAPGRAGRMFLPAS